MINQIVTSAIVLVRIDYGEADRIITVLTPKNGKLKAIAKGVRKPKSKLAGGIELFGVNELTFLPGRGDLHTLISSSNIKNYASIVKSIDRTMLGYEFLKRTNKMVEDGGGEEYFELLQETLAGLDDHQLDIRLLELWFDMQMLKISGHAPNLQTDTSDKKLEDDRSYIFSFDDMTFASVDDGPHSSNLIKLLRLCYATKQTKILTKIVGLQDVLGPSLQLTKAMISQHIRI